MEELSTVRKQYADLIHRTAHLRSNRLVRALSEVPREDYLGAGPWKIMRHIFPLKYEDTPDANPAHIYDDVLVALDCARGLNNGLPSGLAKWIDALDIEPGDRVIHAGCGTGYYTALIAHVAGSEGRVIAIEYDADLAARARAKLRNFPQAEVIAGDATSYDAGPADAIFVNAGATHPLPLWLDSLKPNGRLVFPIVRWPDGAKLGAANAGWGVMVRIQRMRSGHSAQWLSPCGFYPCFGAVDAEADRRLGEAFAQNGLTEVHSLRGESHGRDASCLLHGEGYCFSTNSVSEAS